MLILLFVYIYDTCDKLIWDPGTGILIQNTSLKVGEATLSNMDQVKTFIRCFSYSFINKVREVEWILTQGLVRQE